MTTHENTYIQIHDNSELLYTSAVKAAICATIFTVDTYKYN